MAEKKRGIPNVPPIPPPARTIKGPIEKTYTEKEVTKALKEQIVECAKVIDADNLSVYTARKKIYETKLVKL